MKKTTKKLTLHRETLLRLEEERLAEAAGGLTDKGVCCTGSGSCPPPPSADVC